MNIRKQDLSDYLYDQLGLSKKLCNEITDVFFDEIKDGLIKGKEIRIKNFGKFKLHHKKPRVGRNPKTKQEFPITERVVASFSASKNLRNNIN